MEHNILSIIVTAATLSIFLNVQLKKVNIPPVIGYILTGTILTFIFDFNFATNHALQEVAEFGVVFLMFTIALEISFDQLKSMKREVLFNGHLQMGISTLVFGLISYFVFNIDIKSSIVIGAALGLSSTAIVLKILNENGDISKPYGRKTLGMLLFQDIAVIPIFLMIAMFTDKDSSIILLLSETMFSAAVLIAILYVSGKYILSDFLALVNNTDTQEIFIAAVLLLVVGASMLAHTFGFSYSLGAFMAGLMIAETKYKHQIEADLIPFRDLLLGVFFITVGMQINLYFLVDHFFTIIAIMIIVFFIKALIIYNIVRLDKNRYISLQTAISIAQVGEFSFAVFEIARINSLIDPQINQLLIIAVVFSMIATPFAMSNIKKIIAFADTRLGSREETKIVETKVEHHIVVIGYSTLGQHIVASLKERQIPYLAIDNNQKLIDMANDNGDSILLGNASQEKILHAANIATATAVIIAIHHDESKVRLITESIKAMAPNANVVAAVSNKKEFAELEGLPIHNLVNENEEVAHVMLEHALACQIPITNNYAI
jgi:monovalent cation:H+ antiporter-2, CPA2 family